MPHPALMFPTGNGKAKEINVWFERCAKKSCRRPYQVNEFGGRPEDLIAPGEVTCPHCGHKETRWSKSVFLTHALTPEEEEQYEERFPLPSAAQRYRRKATAAA